MITTIDISYTFVLQEYHNHILTLMNVGYEYQKSKNAVVAQTCDIPNTMQCQLLREIKDNHAISQVSQKSKYFYYFQERCLTYSILFGLFRNEVKSYAGLLFLEI